MGNVLGLDRAKANVIVLMLVAFWEYPTQDTRVRGLMDATMSNVTKFTQSVGAYRTWQYYANVKFLKNVSLKYDPGQTFQLLAPSGWKLGDRGKRKTQFNFKRFERFNPSSTEASALNWDLTQRDICRAKNEL